MRRLLLPLFGLVLLAGSASAQSTIFLVRHAEKASGEGVDPKDPDLSVTGHDRAETLAVMLKDTNIGSIYATEFKRTRQTAEAIARAAGVRITEVSASATERLVAQLKDATGNVLVIGHSNTLPLIIQALAGGEPTQIEENEYDDLFVLVRSPAPQLLRLHYPPARQ